MRKAYLSFSTSIMGMDGHRLALGLFLVLTASGCAEMAGEPTEGASLDNLTLNVEDVENVTEADYREENETELSHYDLNLSSTIRKVDSFFTQDGNLSEAPESIQSIVVALNSSQQEESVLPDSNSSIDIEGYEARQLNSTNSTILYGEKENISFFVRTDGGGIYSSTRQLYLEMAEEIENFREKK